MRVAKSREVQIVQVEASKNDTPPLLIVPCVVANDFCNSGSCDCFGVLDCGNLFPKKQKHSLCVYSPDLVWPRLDEASEKKYGPNKLDKEVGRRKAGKH